MTIRLIQVPYDSGQRAERMGRGPAHLVAGGLLDRLRARGGQAEAETVEALRPFRAEIHTAFDLARQIAGRVADAITFGDFPLVLAGNCISALGTVSGAGPERLGILWLDAHGDFNTPETTESGFLDGMGLAAITGRCWAALARSVPGFAPVPDAQVVMVGVRQLDPGEKALLDESGITLVPAQDIRERGPQSALSAALAGLRQHVDRIYLHLDLDVLDPSVGQANPFPEPGGLLVEDVEEAIGLVADQFSIAAAAVTSYDPQYDEQGTMRSAALGLIERLVGRRK